MHFVFFSFFSGGLSSEFNHVIYCNDDDDDDANDDDDDDDDDDNYHDNNNGNDTNDIKNQLKIGNFSLFAQEARRSP